MNTPLMRHDQRILRPVVLYKDKVSPANPGWHAGRNVLIRPNLCSR